LAVFAAAPRTAGGAPADPGEYSDHGIVWGRVVEEGAVFVRGTQGRGDRVKMKIYLGLILYTFISIIIS
jgi:hypothetical protein